MSLGCFESFFFCDQTGIKTVQYMIVISFFFLSQAKLTNLEKLSVQVHKCIRFQTGSHIHMRLTHGSS